MRINYKRKNKFFGKFLIFASLILVMGVGALALITSNSQAEVLPTTRTIRPEWSKTRTYETISSAVEGSDDSYVAVGKGYNQYERKNYAYIIKYDNEGNFVWDKKVGGGQYIYDTFNSVARVVEDGEEFFIAVGQLYSGSSIEGLTSHGGNDGLIIKYDTNGNVVWQKAWGGTLSDEFTSVKIDNNGDYIVVGDFDSRSIEAIDDGEQLTNNSKFNDSEKGSDAVIIKYDKDGNVVWQKNYPYPPYYGQNYYDYYSEVLVDGNNYVAIGRRAVSYAYTFRNAGFIVKYDGDGNILWTKIWETTNERTEAIFSDLTKASDGNYVVVGYFEGTVAAVDSGEQLTASGDADAMIIKFDSSTGNVVWQKKWGGDGSSTWRYDSFGGIDTAPDGNLIVMGSFGSNYVESGGSGIPLYNRIQKTVNDTGHDGAIIKYDNDGNILWQDFTYAYLEHSDSTSYTYPRIIKYGEEEDAFRVNFNIVDPETNEESLAFVRTALPGGNVERVISPEKEGYQFLGWFEKDGNGDFKEKAFDFYNTSVESDIDLYARFSDKVTIKFEILEAGISPLPEVSLEPVITDVGGTATLPTPTSDDYTFVGWFSNGYESSFSSNTFNFSNKIEEGKTYDKDITLYGYWKNTKEDHTVNFNISGEKPSYPSYNESQVIRHGDIVVYSGSCGYRNNNFRYQEDGSTWTVQFNKRYYCEYDDGANYNGTIFNGWYVDAEMTTKFDPSTPITSNLDLYGSFYSPYLFVKNDKLLDGNGNEFDEEEADGKVHWDSETRTLTLDGYDEEEYLPIKIENDDNTVTIILRGNNNLNLESSTPVVIDGNGELNGAISVDGKISINNGIVNSERIMADNLSINDGDVRSGTIMVRSYFAMNDGMLTITALGEYPTIMVNSGFATFNGGVVNISGLMPMVVNYPGDVDENIATALAQRDMFCSDDRLIAQINTFVAGTELEPFSDGADCLARFDTVYPVAITMYYEQEYGPLPEKGGVAFNGGDVTFKVLTKEEGTEAYPFVIAVKNMGGTTSEDSISIREGLVRDPEELSVAVFDLAGEGDYATFGNGGPASFTPVTDPETGETRFVAENLLDSVHIYERKQDITYHWQDDKDEYETNSEDTELKLIIDVDFDHFDHKVEVDGKEIIAGTDYEAVSGSTEITLKKDYLNSLATGEHEIKVYFANMSQYNDTQVSTAFTIKKKANPEPVNPDDDKDDNKKDEEKDDNTANIPDTSGGTEEKTGDHGIINREQSFVALSLAGTVTIVSLISGIVLRKRKKTN